MADAKAPVAIRISRPFTSEAEWLENERESVSKTGIVLLGAQSRPEGVVLRFEVTLGNGTSLIRGEGRVTGMKKVRGEAGLALRFTRLDSKSKALVDRATGAAPTKARDEGPASVAPPPASMPPPEPRAPELAKEGPPAQETKHAAEGAAALEATDASTHAHAASNAPPRAASAPAPTLAKVPSGEEREAMLRRLRERASTLSDERIQAILASRAPSRGR